MVTVSRSTVDRAAQAAQHVGHQRHVEDLRAVGERRRALGQQRRRHQLEHAVLGPDHVDGAHAAGRRRSPRNAQPRRSTLSARRAGPPGYRPPMAVHLTRIYTRTGDDGTTALGDFSRVRKTDVRLAAYADTDEANAAIGVAVTVGGLSDGGAGRRCGRSRTTCSTWARTCARRSSTDPEYPPLRITEDYVTRLEGWCDEFNAGLPKLDSFILPGGTPGGAYLHVARTVDPPRRAVGVGAAGRRRRAHQPADRDATSTGSRTCCSSSAGWPTPTVTCCGAPAVQQLSDQSVTRRDGSGRLAVAGACGRAGAASSQDRKPVSTPGVMAELQLAPPDAAAQHRVGLRECVGLAPDRGGADRRSPAPCGRARRWRPGRSCVSRYQASSLPR